MSSEDSMSRAMKSYSTLKFDSKSKKVNSSKMLTIEHEASKEKRRSVKKRKRMYSY